MVWVVEGMCLQPLDCACNKVSRQKISWKYFMIFVELTKITGDTWRYPEISQLGDSKQLPQRWLLSTSPSSHQLLPSLRRWVALLFAWADLFNTQNTIQYACDFNVSPGRVGSSMNVMTDWSEWEGRLLWRSLEVSSMLPALQSDRDSKHVQKCVHSKMFPEGISYYKELVFCSPWGDDFNKWYYLSIADPHARPRVTQWKIVIWTCEGLRQSYPPWN